MITRLQEKSTITKDELAIFKNVRFHIQSAGVKIGEVTTEIAQQVSKDRYMALKNISAATAVLDLEFMLR